MENILKGFSTFVLLLDLSLKGQMYAFSLNQNVGGGTHPTSEVENIYTFHCKRKLLIILILVQGGSTPNIPRPRCTVSIQ